MRQVAIIGAGMTKFGKFIDRSLKDLGREAVEGALSQAGVEKSGIEAAVVGNACWAEGSSGKTATNTAATLRRQSGHRHRSRKSIIYVYITTRAAVRRNRRRRQLQRRRPAYPRHSV